ncbi:MAG: family 16 glycosylhydrolase [Candidatus Azobacteroides sp.]|nr:family 16 glycosylhydrolase [Candidatus Azobacteroides sp.]
MRKELYFLIFLLSVGCLSLQAQDEDYELVWSDEFDGDEINTENWNFEIGGGGWGNRELQYYTDRRDNSFIRDGKLVIKVLQETYGNNNYTSARLTTKGKHFFKYGKIEALIKLPKGKGTWPAFWMMPEKSEYGTWPRSGEVDIMEHVGSDPGMISYAMHTRNRNGSSGNNWHYQIYPDVEVEGEFHKYGIEWLEDRFVFLFNDEKQTTYWNDLMGDYASWPFDKEFFIILNVAIGGLMGGTVDNSIFNSDVEMEVDYVKVYQKKATGISETPHQHIDVKVTDNSQTISIKGLEEKAVVEIYDLLGNKWEQMIATTNELTIDTASFPKGMLIINIEQQGTKKSYKIII